VLELEHSWALLLLPLPLLPQLLPAHREEREALRAPFFARLVELTGREPAPGAVVLRATLLQRVLVGATWLLLVAALAAPQWVGDPITKIESARDLMLAVDLSGSMEARDFTDADGDRVDRLQAVKLVLDDFVARRRGDRIGLIVFGNQAFLQAPFTQDHDTFRILLDETRVRMAGPQTMLGDAIGLAIKLFEAGESENRVLILLTDGNDTGSKVPPARAAEIAAEHGITIHPVAIGDPETSGEEALDEEALRELAGGTGGRYFHAEDREELDSIYRTLDEIEPEELESLSYRPTTPLFHWPLGVGLAFNLAFYLALAARTPRRAGARTRA